MYTFSSKLRFKVCQWAIVAVVPFLICACSPTMVTPLKSTQDDMTNELTYLPVVGDRAIIFIHRFNTDVYEEGKKIVVEGLSQAMKASGQTRRTYFMDNAESHEVVVASFFHSNSSVEGWMSNAGRQDILNILRPLYRDPLQIKHLTVKNVHDAPVEASYLPRNGDRAILFTHRFKANDYEKGKKTVIEGFSQAIEAAGQTRRTYHTETSNPRELVALSFFHPSSVTDEWLRHPERNRVLKMLKPLLLEPVDVHALKVEDVHDTD